MKAVGKRYGSKQMSEDVKQSGLELEGKGEAAAGGGKQSDGSTAGKAKGDSFGVPAMDSHYAECYPGGMEEYDATYDSDEDVDFSKMDMVNIHVL